MSGAQQGDRLLEGHLTRLHGRDSQAEWCSETGISGRGGSAGLNGSIAEL